MVGASKILTVSYGTFSCTLEGFEEPFSTMKAIAEYFRDLAADDRYFGAEPPTPDAEMLHRIAEREIQRRVEAKISEHGVVLRAETAPAAQPVVPPAAEAAALTTAAAAPAVAEAAPAPMPPAETAPDTFEAETEADAAADVFADYLQEEAPAVAFEPEEADTDSVAAKLSRIRAVVAAAQAAPAAAVEDEETAADFAPSATVPAGDFGFELDLDDMPARPAAEPAHDDETLVDMEEDDSFEEIEEIAPAAEAELEAPVVEIESDADIEVDAEADEIAAAEARADEIETTAEVIAAVDAPEAESAEAEVAEVVDAEAVAEEDAFEEESDDDTILAGIEELFEESAEEEVEAAALAEAEAPEAEEAAAEDDMADNDMADEGVSEEIATQEDAFEEDAVEEDVAEDDVAEKEEIAAAALDLGAWRLDAEDDQVSASEDTAEEDIDVAAERELETEVEAELEDEASSDAQDEIELADEAEVEDEDELEIKDEAEFEAEAEATTGTDEVEAAEETAPEPATAKRGFFGQAAARVIKIRKTLSPVRDEAPAHDTAADEADEFAADETGTADAPERDDSEDRSAAIFAALNEEAAIDEEFDEAEAEDVTAEDTDAALLAGIGAAIGETGLDPEAEDDLLRELADVARDARRDSHEGRAILESNASDGEASVERLMEEAKSKLEGDESRRRFSAISHLKAAVVATVADRKLKLRDAPVSGEADAGEEIERYRDDLSKAVRPRRPSAESAPTTRRPTIETRQAPLVLISEQRIDAPESPRTDAAVVRPRRISAGNLVLNDDIEQDNELEAALSPEEAKSFAEFADRLGAVNLSDMLEAAAAYTATVEGLPHFSRPQILRKVANVAEDEEYSREDGLRSFGMLLRQGKIQKIRRGQFTITETSKFMSEARRAAR